jgi:hypothetical protein
MKQAKQRIIALDYFRGLFILMVVINHSWVFSMPFTYLTGAGAMWTSAAELFFLLSGATMVIVRGNTIKNRFMPTAKRIWRRAGIVYLFHILLVSLSLELLYLLPSSNTAIGLAPSAQGFNLFWQILTFQYAIGGASFLMYYAVFLALAPFALYLIKSRLWPLLLGASISLFVLAAKSIIPAGTISWFCIWQIYFVLGMALALIREPVTNWFRSLPERRREAAFSSVMAITAISLAVNVLMAFHIYPFVNSLTNQGWLPEKLRGAYYHLLKHGAIFDQLFGSGRLGLLRPLAAILFLAAFCLIYVRYQSAILRKSGRFIITLGKETLWIFAAQAIVIPVMAALPVPRNIAMNFIMTLSLVFIMWAVTQRRTAIQRSRNYVYDLKLSYTQAKTNYLSQVEE